MRGPGYLQRVTGRKTPAGQGQLVFIENHDLTRFASVVKGDLRREKVGAALDILLKGTPLIYYGQELGMKGVRREGWKSDGNDIPDREAFEWSRKVEAPGERVLPSGQKDVLLVARSWGAATSLLLVNLGDSTRVVTGEVFGPGAANLRDLISGERVVAGGELRMELPPYAVKLVGRP